MKREAGGPCLSAVFVDYDNIYLSLKRKSEEAAKRFAKDAPGWLRGIETGRLITATNAPFSDDRRRIVMNRCYGNPVPRRNTHDNSTDMNSFPFVRHHFLRAGFEVIDCPPLTAQLKNSSDIRMVMDIRDYLTHDTYFDEFIILSGDADFTPVLHRLRAHARRTVIFANDFTAAPYTAISDGEVRESDLIALILSGEMPKDAGSERSLAMPSAKADETRREILAEVVGSVRASSAPVPLEALAERAMRALGHDKTIGTSWAGAGSFRELLRQQLPAEIKLTGEPPYAAYDAKRHGDDGRATALEARDPASEAIGATQIAAKPGVPETMPLTAAALQQALPASAASLAPTRPSPNSPPAGRTTAAAAQTAAPPAASSAAIQQSITRIQDACQAPPLAPHEYRLLFEVMAKEISDNDLIGAQTLANITQRAQERGLDVRRDDVRFVLEVVSEADPWFEQGASANLFAGRFRNFVVARCRGQGLNLSADELDLIDAWFAGGTLPQPQTQATQAPPAPPAYASEANPPAVPPPAPQRSSAPAPSGLARWWTSTDSRKEAPETSHGSLRPIAGRSRRLPAHRPHPLAQLTAKQRPSCRQPTPHPRSAAVGVRLWRAGLVSAHQGRPCRHATFDGAERSVALLRATPEEVSDGLDLVLRSRLQQHLAGEVEMAVLDYSSHVVTVDRQRHIVAERTVALADAAEPSEPVAKVVSLPRSVGRRRERMA